MFNKDVDLGVVVSVLDKHESTVSEVDVLEFLLLDELDLFDLVLFHVVKLFIDLGAVSKEVVSQRDPCKKVKEDEEENLLTKMEERGTLSFCLMMLLTTKPSVEISVLTERTA